MSFNPNKTPIETIKEGAFGGTYFRDIYSDINGKWYRNSWKEFDFLRDIDPKLYLSNYYDTIVNKYKIKCGTSFRFWENKGWICEQDPYGWFQWYCRYYLATKGLLTLGGVIDSNYTGEIIVIMTSLIEPIKIKKGQKIAQLVVSNIMYPE